MTERTRTFSWQDPMISAKTGPTMSGLEFLQSMASGELPPPPIMAALNIDGMEVEHGRVVFSVIPAEYHYNPIGVVHGGLTCTLCDSAMACAIQSTFPAGIGYTTLELKINFTRPITVNTGRVFCEGKTIHVGSRIATAECRVTDESGKLYAHATTTCIVLK